jgi:hypothetical protein
LWVIGPSLIFLADKLSALPSGGAVLEFGAQEVNSGTSKDDVLYCARASHQGDEKAALKASACYDPAKPMPMSALFIDSPIRYRCIDLMPGPTTIVADLNTFSVPQEDRGTFDLITNWGTSEHVTDQVNAFRVIHDYARVGTLMIHMVPFCGYFNHGLFNYHPVFFVFLAHANGYKIESLELSGPHLPYTIPEIDGLIGCSQWQSRQESGILGCLLRKTSDAPFKLFTDFDQAAMGRLAVPEPWAAMIRERYDLRIR